MSWQLYASSPVISMPNFRISGRPRGLGVFGFPFDAIFASRLSSIPFMRSLLAS